jgi:hypothetical protein
MIFFHGFGPLHTDRIRSLPGGFAALRENEFDFSHGDTKPRRVRQRLCASVPPCEIIFLCPGVVPGARVGGRDDGARPFRRTFLSPSRQGRQGKGQGSVIVVPIVVALHPCPDPCRDRCPCRQGSGQGWASARPGGGTPYTFTAKSIKCRPTRCDDQVWRLGVGRAVALGEAVLFTPPPRPRSIAPRGSAPRAGSRCRRPSGAAWGPWKREGRVWDDALPGRRAAPGDHGFQPSGWP